MRTLTFLFFSFSLLPLATACGSSSSDGGAPVATSSSALTCGAGTAIAHLDQMPRNVVAKGGYAWITTWGQGGDQTHGELLRVATKPGANVETIATELGVTTALAIGDDGAAYVIDYPTRLLRVGADGKTSVLATESIVAVDVDEAHAYFASTRGVGRVPLAGGAVEWMAEGEDASSVAVRGDTLYWMGSDVKRMPKDGGPITTLATGLGERRAQPSLDVRDGFVFWTNMDRGEAYRVPATGGAPSTLATGLRCPYGATAIAGDVLIAEDAVACGTATDDKSLRAIVRLPSHQAIADAHQQGIGGAFGTDAAHVYWGGGTDVWCADVSR